MSTDHQSFAELFPMPMTSIEKFHWFDDAPDYPNVVYCRMRVSGKLDKETARNAWQVVIERQPFGDVRPEKVNGKLNWLQGPRASDRQAQDFSKWDGTKFAWEEFEQPPTAWQFQDHRTKSPTGSFLGVSVFPAEKGSNEFVSEIWLYVHHAISDGAGSIQCANDWMNVYANLRMGKQADAGLHRLDPDLLKTRNSLGILSWRYLKHLWKQPIALFGAAKFVFRKTAELAPGLPSNQAGQIIGSPNIIGQWISDDQVKRLSRNAKQNEVMLNSVLLGELYNAITEWRKKHGVHQPHDWLRIIVPMSIRNVSDRRLPAANRATLVQVDRCEKDTKDQRKLYHYLNREIMIIRGWQLDKMFLLVIRMLSAFEPLLRRAATKDKSRGMAVFANLGEPLRKSERSSARQPDSDAFIRPFEFDFVGPIREGTPVNFSISKYNKAIRVSMQYDGRVLTNKMAQQLLDKYCNQLNSIQ
ncbi:MAG: hypothetical protein AB8B55_01455 [Mariniblastus sp.]